MDRGSAEEAVVGVKPVADEGAVTYLRIKLQESTPCQIICMNFSSAI